MGLDVGDGTMRGLKSKFAGTVRCPTSMEGVGCGWWVGERTNDQIEFRGYVVGGGAWGVASTRVRYTPPCAVVHCPVGRAQRGAFAMYHTKYGSLGTPRQSTKVLIFCELVGQQRHTILPG